MVARSGCELLVLAVDLGLGLVLLAALDSADWVLVLVPKQGKMERIIAHKIVEGKPMFLVKWL